MPAEIATGLALAAVAALFAWRLSRKGRYNGQLCVWLWAFAFAAIGSGVLIGVFRQILLAVLSTTASEVLLQLSLALWLLAHALLLSGALLAYSTGRSCILGMLAVAFKLGLFLLYINRHPTLDAVLFDGMLTSIALMALSTYGAWTWRYPHGQWIVAGGVLWLFAAVLHQGRVGLGPHFPPASLFRAGFIVVLSLWVRGGWHLRDSRKSAARFAFKRIGWRF